jgi:type II secretory pathway component PulF
MPRFFYRAKISPSETASGILEAATADEAVRKIMDLGQIPLNVSLDEGEAGPAQEGAVLRPFFAPGVSLKLLADFTRQLFDLVDAGVPILRSLEILGKSLSNAVLKKAAFGMQALLKDGSSLSSAMARFPEVFPAYYVHMVRSGESSGHLPEVLSRLAASLEKDAALRSRVAASLMYPGIVFGVGVLTFFVLLTFVMPKLSALFEDFDAALPVPTQIVMALSHWMAGYWWLVAAGAFLLGAAAVRYASTESGREAFDRGLLRVPLLGDFIRKSEAARLARTLATLLEGGVPVASAIEAVAAVTGNTVIRGEIRQTAAAVKSGESLTRALDNSRACWSETAVSMISVGEETGRLEKGLYKLGASLERETEEAAGIFVTVLGPLVLLLVVGAIGAMVVCMLLPLFQMNAVMGQ